LPILKSTILLGFNRTTYHNNNETSRQSRDNHNNHNILIDDVTLKQLWWIAWNKPETMTNLRHTCGIWDFVKQWAFWALQDIIISILADYHMGHVCPVKFWFQGIEFFGSYCIGPMHEEKILENTQKIRFHY